MTEHAMAVCRPLDASDYRSAAHPAVFAELAALGPIHHVVMPGDVPVWLITSRAAANAALRDPRLTKDPLPVAKYGQVIGRRRVPEDFTAVSGRQLMNLDGADHTRIRRVIGNYLSDPALAKRQTTIIDAVEDRLAVLAAGDTADLVVDFATPLVTEVTGRMLGVPVHFNKVLMTLGNRLFGPEDPRKPAMIEAYQHVVDAAEGVWREREPGDEDLVGALVRARREGVITRREFTSNLIMVLVGASGALVRLLTYGAARLIGDLRLRTELLAGEPATVIEHLISSQPPIPFTSWRFATEPMEIAGQAIEAGDAVMVLIAAANRDLDGPTPGEHGGRDTAHLSFGGGVHQCVGRELARRTAATALPALFRRFPEVRLELPVEEFVWRGGLGPRGPERVPVRLTGRARDLASNLTEHPTPACGDVTRTPASTPVSAVPA